MMKPNFDKHFSDSFPISFLEIAGCKVVYEDNCHHLKRHLSLPLQKKFQNLLHEAQIYPKLAYQNALEWEQTGETFPELDNLLTYLHLQHKKVEKAEQLIENSFHKYPDYLFAKINYADQCLRKNKLEEILTIFPSFDLKELFPKKESFHVSEFRGFMTFASHYYLKKKQTTLAKTYFEHAKAADPLHPSIFLLEKKLQKNKFMRFFFKILQVAHIS